MKRLHFLAGLALIVGLLSGYTLTAYAVAPPTTQTVTPGTVQDYAGAPAATAPYKKGDVCVTKTFHNASNTVSFNLYTSGRWYAKSDWKVVNASTGADVVITHKLGDNATGYPASSGSIAVNREYLTHSVSPFGTNTSVTVRICQRRQ